MKKNLLLSLLFVTGLFNTNHIEAAVTPLDGAVVPEISTADSPKWYLLMSSHLSDNTRKNRFLKLDGTTLCTEQFMSGIPEGQVTEAFIWRLESANDGTSTHAYLVNSNGQRVFVPTSATAEDGSTHVNTPLEMNETGTVWDVITSQSTGISNDCAANQYALQYIGYSGARAFMNAMDGGTQFGVTIYAAGVHQASGWFFYETDYSPAVQKTVTIASSDDSKGSVSIEGSNENSVEVGSTDAVTVKAEAAENYMFYRWVEEGTENAVSYRPTYSYAGEESINLVAEFVEKDYPIMTRFYVVDLNQQNRYLSAASYTAGSETHEIFSCESESDLPFTPYVQLHTPQIEGAVINKTETPIQLTEGVESFTLKFKQYNNNITYNNGKEEFICEPELVWTRQAVYVDWNNDMEFNGSNEIYESMGENSATNNFGDPNGSIAEGWQRSIAIPQGTEAGTYRMRVIYMAPDPVDGWINKVFGEFYNELRNGIAYDFEIQISPASGIESVAAETIYYDSQAQTIVAPHMEKAAIYNLAGQVVLQAENADTISVAALAKGVYVAHIDGKVIKFIK